MKETFFFPHDFGARNDPKLQKVLMKLKCEGLGAYWCIVEQIYEQGGSLPLDYESIAFALHVETSVIESLVNDFELFETDGETFWSNSINARMNKRSEIAEKRKQAAMNRWNKKANADETDANAEQNNENDMQDSANKGKEIKGNDNNESNELDSSETSVPADDEPAKNKVDCKRVVDMYHSMCPSYPKLIKLSEARKQKITIRLEEMKFDYSLLESIFREMETSKFLRGDNRNGWKATFDWLFDNSKNWVKVAEGNYKNQESKSNTTKNVNDIWGE